MLHSVFFWLTDDADHAKFEAELEKLATMDLIKCSYIGKPSPTPPRDVVDQSFDYSINFFFDSIEDHNVYQDHPDHEAFVEACSPMFKEVRVYDTGE
jgi:antibiotic biosynthesis monooxygenase (ABM) superfamily enzyme